MRPEYRDVQNQLLILLPNLLQRSVPKLQKKFDYILQREKAEYTLAAAPTTRGNFALKSKHLI